MAQTYTMAPIWFVDIMGATLMVVFSFLSVVYAYRMTKTRSSALIWTYLLWLTLALAVFAVSRSVGHIAKRLLLLLGMNDVWIVLRPWSGALNTITFIVVAAVTLFFQKVQKINAATLADKKALEEAGQQVLLLNRNLELLVQQRTYQLARSEEKYRRVFEGSMDMIFILDSATSFVDINGAGLGMLGYEDKEDVLGSLKFGTIFEEKGEADSILAQLETEGYVKDRECRVMSRRCEEMSLLISATTRRDVAGNVIGYEGFAKDITSRRDMEKQLQMADKLASLGQVSTGIAHEINNPLGIIMGYTQLLLREAPEGAQIREDLTIIQKHARNCKMVVEDLLKFARSTRTDKTTIDLNRCLDEVMSLLSHQLQLDDIVLETFLNDEPLLVFGDAEKLKQVFMNLLVNAKQAISPPGRISITSLFDSNESTVRVSMSDTGCGIPSQVMDKIFDPFFTTKPVGEGTGLGLSVSYGIVQDHNGRIEVESQVGKGSTFIVVLPSGKESLSGELRERFLTHKHGLRA